MAGFDYLIDSEYSGDPAGIPFCLTSCRYSPVGPSPFRTPYAHMHIYRAPYIYYLILSLRRKESRANEQHVVVTGQRRRKRRVTRINSYSTTTRSVMDRSKAESVSSVCILSRSTLQLAIISRIVMQL